MKTWDGRESENKKKKKIRQRRKRSARDGPRGRDYQRSSTIVLRTPRRSMRVPSNEESRGNVDDARSFIFYLRRTKILEDD